MRTWLDDGAKLPSGAVSSGDGLLTISKPSCGGTGPRGRDPRGLRRAMTAWSHVIDLVGRMQAANDRVNAALNVMGLGALPSDECRAIRDGAAAEIEALNSSLAAALAGTGARD